MCGYHTALASDSILVCTWWALYYIRDPFLTDMWHLNPWMQIGMCLYLNRSKTSWKEHQTWVETLFQLQKEIFSTLETDICHCTISAYIQWGNYSTETWSGMVMHQATSTDSSWKYKIVECLSATEHTKFTKSMIHRDEFPWGTAADDPLWGSLTCGWSDGDLALCGTDLLVILNPAFESGDFKSTVPYLTCVSVHNVTITLS